MISYTGGQFIYPGSYHLYSNGDIGFTLANRRRIRLDGMREEIFKRILLDHSFNNLLTYDVFNTVGTFNEN